MECVLADEAADMGGEYDATEWAVLLSLYGDVYIDLSESVADVVPVYAGVDGEQLAQPLSN